MTLVTRLVFLDVMTWVMVIGFAVEFSNRADLLLGFRNRAPLVLMSICIDLLTSPVV